MVEQRPGGKIWFDRSKSQQRGGCSCVDDEKDSSISIIHSFQHFLSLHGPHPILSNPAPSTVSRRLLLEPSKLHEYSCPGVRMASFVDDSSKAEDRECLTPSVFSIATPSRDNQHLLCCVGVNLLKVSIAKSRRNIRGSNYGTRYRKPNWSWWFPKTTEQYRVKGSMLLEGNGPLSS